MDMFNKLYSQVSNSVSVTVSQLSGVLPGNPVTREYDASQHIASAGPGLLWKVYGGRKRSTKQEAAIFVFEKRQLEQFARADRDAVLDLLKRGVVQLTKIRHPRILTVQHQLEESRESLAFATEPICASLANIFGQTHNMPQPTNLTDYKLLEIEIKYGLLQIAEGLAFLHNDVRLLHRNLTPENVVINQQGAWKIFGFDFCVHSTSPANSTPFFPFEMYSPAMPAIAQPSLWYLAPECVLADTYQTSGDIFALGLLCFTLYSHDYQPLLNVRDLQQYKARIKELERIAEGKMQLLPEQLRVHVRSMIKTRPESRSDANLFTKIGFFDDVAVKTLSYLDSLFQWDNRQRAQFYKGLPDALNKLPHRVRIQQILPALGKDLSQPTMIPFVLPSILDIAQQCSEKEYVEAVLPIIKPIMKVIEPIQVLLIFLQRMELLLKLTPDHDIQQHVLPMLYRGLDSDAPQIHELCLTVLPTFANLLDHAHVKNSVLPRIKRLCLATTTLSVKVNCLLCIGRLLEHLDKWLVLDEVLPFLPQIPSREPAVLMAILGIYKLAMTHTKLGITKEVMASRILPFLMPLCIENGLSLAQFNALVALVKQMFQRVEAEHRTKLEQLHNVAEEGRALDGMMGTVTMMPQAAPARTDLHDAFAGLGLNEFVGGAKAASLCAGGALLEPKVTSPPPLKAEARDLSANLSPIDSRLWANVNRLNASGPVAPAAPASSNWGMQVGGASQAGAFQQWSHPYGVGGGVMQPLPMNNERQVANTSATTVLSKDDMMDLLS